MPILERLKRWFDGWTRLNESQNPQQHDAAVRIIGQTFDGLRQKMLSQSTLNEDEQGFYQLLGQLGRCADSLDPKAAAALFEELGKVCQKHAEKA